MSAETNRGPDRALRRYQRYPEYKDSGVEWLGEVPAHWEVKRLRSTVTSSHNGVWGDEADGNHDVICVRVADFDRVGFRVDIADPTLRSIEPAVASARGLHPGDLLLEKSGGGENQPVGALVLYDHNVPAVCSNFVARLSVAEGYDPRFLTFLHAALYACRINTRHIKQSTGIQNIDSATYLSEPTGLPPEPEQRAVAAFLDRETARIDALVAKKERLIELLREQRTALISRAVTKGLDPSVPIKDSGVDWLGEVPAHWEVKALKYFLRAPLAYGVLKPDKYAGRDGVRLIRILDVASGQVSEDALELISPDQSKEFRRTVVRTGELVISVVGTIGRAFIVPPSLEGANLSRALARVQLKPTMEARFLEYGFSATSFYSFVDLVPAGTAQRVLNLGDLAEYVVAAPTAIEQHSIAAFLDRETARIDALIAKVREAIARLHELRAALISAAVTGKIDVREEAA